MTPIRPVAIIEQPQHKREIEFAWCIGLLCGVALTAAVMLLGSRWGWV